MAKKEFSEIIKQQIENYASKEVIAETGIVLSVGDGIVLCSGLDNILLNEIVEFENGSKGLALNLEESTVGVVMLDDFTEIKQGDIVKRTKEIASVAVGEELSGRVVDALGRPIDNLGEFKETTLSPIEKIAPGVMARQTVNQPLKTGILSIDSMFPIGKGQRELIIGDRETGKTTIGIDAIINQHDKNVKCIYVAIGQKNSTIGGVIRTLKANNAMSYTTVVVASASDLPAIKYIAPFAGITIGEYWMNKGEDVLIVFDDLSKHAVAYRTLSLLLRRPPGREAFPGDVFYLHSRLLERAGRTNAKHGGGSITALPIIETQAGDISAYIPTNVISITDGQLFMMSSLFKSGQRPAVDAGLSVSRVGSAAQTKFIKKFSGSLKVELASFRELEAFSQFGSDLDKATKSVLSRGRKITAMMKQSRSSPWSSVEETLMLFTIDKKYLSFIPSDNIQDFKISLVQYFKDSEVSKLIEQDNPTDDVIKKIDYAMRIFISNFLTKFDLLSKISQERQETIKSWDKTISSFKSKASEAITKLDPDKEIGEGDFQTKKNKTPSLAQKASLHSSINKDRDVPLDKQSIDSFDREDLAATIDVTPVDEGVYKKEKSKLRTKVKPKVKKAGGK